MDLRSHLLDLVAPHCVGDIVCGARLVGASTELGLRLTFDASGRDVHIEVEPFDPSRRFAARTPRLALSYRAASDDEAGVGNVGLALCRAVAALACVNEDRVLAAIAQDAAAAAAIDDATSHIREVRVGRLLEPAGTPEARHYTLSTYVGCTVGCRFCYAQSRLAGARRLERLPEVRWGSYVDVRVNAAEVLACELEGLPARVPIKFCPIVSDPYQAAEKRYGVTRACLETLRDACPDRPVLVLTRMRLVERDADVLAAAPGFWVGASVPTFDDEVRKHFEPRASPISDRLAALAAFRSAGVRTFAVVQPMLPGPIESLADALADAVSSVSLDVLHGVEGAADDFSDPRYIESGQAGWQERRAGDLAAALRVRGVAVWTGELPPELDARARR